MKLLFHIFCVLPVLSSCDKSKWIGKTDPSSFSNPEEFLTQNLTIKWNVDFENKIVSGSVSYDFLILNKDADHLILDTNLLKIEKVVSLENNGTEKTELAFEVGESFGSFGSPLKINVGNLLKTKSKGNRINLQIHYKTTQNSTSLAWVDPKNTLGKKHPYMFSSNQPINARSLLPCQDTPSVKAPFFATVSVPKELRCLMGAIGIEDHPDPESSHDHDNLKVFKFLQNIPIPSYLIAIAVGNLESRVIGPRSRIWAEKQIVDKAATEFSDTEKMIVAGETLFGPYIWGVYDILIMPSNYPLLGMENPGLTFVPPFVIAGDKSMTYVIAHEIAHSWTGNLVTNHDWQHFWINEGFTKFAERKILASLYGEGLSHLVSIQGRDKLISTIKEKGEDDPLTSLVLDLNGVDPDETKSVVPYEKGCIFLYFLEEKVGGSQVFNEFLYQYIQNNSRGSVDSSQFRDQFISYFKSKGMGDKIKDVEWDMWLYSPGLPPIIPNYDRKSVDPCTNLKNRWLQWNPEKEKVPFRKSDLDGLHTLQIAQFLEELMINEEGPIAVGKLEKLEEIYGISKQDSVQIKMRWIRIGVMSKWNKILKPAFDFVNEYGQLVTMRKVYQDLYKWEEVREQVIKNFNENKGYMMPASAKLVTQDLNLNEG